MKNIFKTMLTSIMLSSSLLLSSCGSFSMEDELVISKISTEELQNGDILVTIIYTDEDIEPTSFIVPKGVEGEKGESGVGIKDIILTPSDDGKYTTLTISYTDSNFPDEEITFPNGISVKGVKTEIDSQGNTVLKLIYTDDSVSEGIVLTKGIDGNGIENCTSELDSDGNTIVTFKMTQSDDYTVTIPKANGIANIISRTEGNKYVLEITYDNGTIQTVDFDVPTINNWLTGNTNPSNNVGINGDYYFDLSTKSIYVKQDNQWNFQVALDQESSYYNVKFELNATGDSSASLNIGSHSNTYLVQGGTYFSSTGYSIPEPTRDGYDFAGWYTSNDDSPNIGHFTDLTPIMSDLTLYARWEETTDSSLDEEEQTN